MGDKCIGGIAKFHDPLFKPIQVLGFDVAV